ncbi:HD domain-containing protein [Meiothermus taiwanensis]|jgi:putative nucleotidyltransferase with HDIG domain|uniref:HDIG domain protein n=2 Tax=Meiothermus taiwanensis TaxID=172827 RepID=A0A399DT43_9DEIN|nr:HD domain-containing protein [Meiothermus taiwanensis]AWR86053.1 metal dependent phosphohydrolase [Meiothermus taiwanensis WR-220]KIQ55209.1 HAD family hydrolase [Meiothermus taiwanensis]KZK16920.1 HAD family hydrolase [Meiothermus taiwanensis]RIH75207.1 HDIG domain protein [Meiothermus taiwanensis]
MAIYMVYEDALALMKRFTPSESLQKHMMAVETAMRAYARKYGQPEEKWAITGILHDFDYERFPEEHPYKGVEMLREMGYPEDVLEAILGHVDSPQHPRTSLMSKALFAVDELVGLITAAVYVRPDKRIQSLELPSLKKKFKDKAFAAKVDREGIVRGAQELGVDLDEHMAFVLEAMKADAARLGLG